MELKSNETLSLKIFKYDPTTDDKPYYKTFKVPFNKYMTVREALDYVNDYLGGAIAYRSFSPSTPLGAPAIMVNGVPATPHLILEKAEQLTIEPLPILPVIKDLVQDMERIYEIKTRLRLFHQPTRPYPGKVGAPVVIDRYNENFDIVRTDMIQDCVDCYACVAACPVIEADWREFVGPYFMLQLVAYGLHPEDRGDRVGTAFREGLYNCTMCGKCKEVCYWDIDVPGRVLERLRREAVDKGLSPLPAHRGFTERLSETGRIMPRVEKSLIESLPEVVDVENPQREVAFFTGCQVDYNLQKVGHALINVLKKNKVRVHIPKGQECCGYPLLKTGQPVAYNFIRRNETIFSAFETVVTLCSHCGMTLKKDYPKMLGMENSFKVMDITEFLTKEIKLKTEEMGELRLRATYHDPCHLRIGQEIYEEPREILRKVPGLEFVEMKRSDLCCGGGGGLRSGNPVLSMKLANRKVPMIKESGAQAVVTTCPWCQLNLTDSLTSIPKEERAEVMNTVEILERAYNKG